MKKKYNIGKDNPMYGKKHTPKSRQKMRLAKLETKNPLWRGDNVGYCGLHLWVKARKPKPVFCEECGKQPPYDLTAINDIYTRDLSDWQWLCRKCHMTKDKRIINRDKNGKFKMP